MTVDPNSIDLPEFLAAIPDGPRALLLEGHAGIGKTTLWWTPSGVPSIAGTGCCRPDRLR